MIDAQGNRQRSDSMSSVQSLESILPPPTPFKKAMLVAIFILVILTVAQVVIACVYSAISGNSAHWYEKPDSWEFCIIYAMSTIEKYDHKIVDSLPTTLAYLGLMNMLYTWVALAATFRALYHYEWIPSTLAFLIYNAFGQLCYYQSSNLVIVPSRLVASLISVTRWFSWDMYDDMGHWCFDVEYAFGLGDLNPPTKPFPKLQDVNCSDSIALVEDSYADLNQLDALKAIANNTIPNSDLNCGGAVNLHFVFLLFNYLMFGLTCYLIVILVLGDRNIRQQRPLRHFLESSKEDLVGDRFATILTYIAGIGYFVTSVALCDASFIALKSSEEWPLIDLVMPVDTDLEIEVLGLPIEAKIGATIDVEFQLNTWLPFRQNMLDLQTVLLITTTMAVLRGTYKQSISAFRLASVTSLLAVIIQWPVIVGNLETFQLNDLWWWSPTHKCNDFHSGQAFLYPGEHQSERLCRDTRAATAGALIQFIAMNLNIIACSVVYFKNLERASLRFSQDVPADFGAEAGFPYDSINQPMLVGAEVVDNNGSSSSKPRNTPL